MTNLCTHTPLSPAVQRCCDVRNRMIERDRNMPPEELPQIPADRDDLKAMLKFQADSMIMLHALDPGFAYRTAMPDPIGRRNIKNFIACVTHGIAIGAIEPDQARNMLHAARTAALATVKRIRNRKPAQPEISPNPLESVD